MLFRLHDCYDTSQLKPLKRSGISGIHHGDALVTEANFDHAQLGAHRDALQALRFTG
jgi:hypothetical protein